jgi:hypothetical protein
MDIAKDKHIYKQIIRYLTINPRMPFLSLLNGAQTTITNGRDRGEYIKSQHPSITRILNNPYSQMAISEYLGPDPRLLK